MPERWAFRLFDAAFQLRQIANGKIQHLRQGCLTEVGAFAQGADLVGGDGSGKSDTWRQYRRRSQGSGNRRSGLSLLSQRAA